MLRIVLVLLAFLYSSIAFSNDIIERIKNNFIVFDEMRFKNKPSIDDLGFEPIRVIYVSELSQSKKAEKSPDINYISELFKKKFKPKNELVCLDIEHWDYDQRKSGAIATETGMSSYISVLDTIKLVRPELIVGYYGTLPIRDYFSPVKERNIASWHKANDALSPLAKNVDIIFPSLYTFYKSPDDWEKYALANIQEARKYGKPVVPFLWPQYHGSNQYRKDDYIDCEFWKRQLELVYKYADGVVIWTPYSGGTIPWNEDAEWWQSMKLFMLEKKLSTTMY